MVFSPEREQRLDGRGAFTIRLRWYRLGEGADTVAVLWPGLRYTCDAPLLARATHLLQARGVTVVQVWADYAHAAFRRAPGEKRWLWLLADALGVMQAVHHEAPLHRLVWVGKSLGTLAMAALWLEGQGRDLAASVWFTPLLAFPAVVKTLAHVDTPALAVASREDPTFDPRGWQVATTNTQVETLLLERGDHSLEVPADSQSTQANLGQVSRRLESFLDAHLD